MHQRLACPGFLNHFYLDIDMCMCKRILPRLLITGYKQLKQVMLILSIDVDHKVMAV